MKRWLILLMAGLLAFGSCITVPYTYPQRRADLNGTIPADYALAFIQIKSCKQGHIYTWLSTDKRHRSMAFVCGKDGDQIEHSLPMAAPGAPALMAHGQEGISILRQSGDLVVFRVIPTEYSLYFGAPAEPKESTNLVSVENLLFKAPEPGQAYYWGTLTHGTRTESGRDMEFTGASLPEVRAKLLEELALPDSTKTEAGLFSN